MKHTQISRQQERQAARSTQPQRRALSADALAAQERIEQYMASRVAEGSLPAIVLRRYGLNK